MRTLYAVLCLSTTVDYTDGETGETKTMPVNNAAGFIPVFETKEEAEARSFGKYKVVPIQDLGTAMFNYKSKS